jgi:saccharopine dehydrogenase-like NADP-dependent oxidoreductase
MKTFEIQYVSRYYEEKQYSSEIVSAKSPKNALREFAGLFNIKNYKQIMEPTFTWENGEWISNFICINEIEEVLCLCCNGTGKIKTKK